MLLRVPIVLVVMAEMNTIYCFEELMFRTVGLIYCGGCGYLWKVLFIMFIPPAIYMRILYIHLRQLSHMPRIYLQSQSVRLNIRSPSHFLVQRRRNVRFPYNTARITFRLPVFGVCFNDILLIDILFHPLGNARLADAADNETNQTEEDKRR